MTDLLTPATAPTERARYLLAREAYSSPEWFDREQHELFRRVWNLAAHVDDIPRSGDFVPVDVARDPVLLVRQHDGSVLGFVNMCRHRGMTLTCEPGTTSTNIRCPYHGWEFGPDGSLVRIPQRASQFPDVDPAEWGLLPVRVAVWDGMIFVNPDGRAPGLEEWLGDYPERVGPFDNAALVEIFRLRVPVACNWKLYIENHIDVLHLWYLHDESLGMYDHTRFLHDKVGLHWVSEERLRPGQKRQRGLEPIAQLPASERDVLRANLIFPNVPTSSSETQTMTYQVIPIGPESSVLDIRVRAEAGGTLDEEGQAILLRVLRDEDGLAVEQIQRALRSPRFEVGPLAAEHEAPITAFQRDVLAHLG